MEEDKKVDSMSCTADEVGAEGHMDGSRRGGGGGLRTKFLVDQ